MGDEAYIKRAYQRRKGTIEEEKKNTEERIVKKAVSIQKKN
jgi:hypothetical protein